MIADKHYVASAREQALRSVADIDYNTEAWLNRHPLSFVDYPYRIAPPTSITSDVHPVSGDCRATNEMHAPGLIPPDIDAFVSNSSSKGTIYLAFGSFVQFSGAPEYIIDAFIDMFTNMSDYRFLWAYRSAKKCDRIPANVYVTTWAPQIAILSHNKTLLFISHGGMKRWV
jgi:UDP:flavonoid glycosyltransferase YjiC (YdhE family)